MATNNIGASIAALRKEKGVTQETLAAAVGVSGQAVSKWETGGMPDAELFPAIADYFAVPIDCLFGRVAPVRSDSVDAFMDTLKVKDGVNGQSTAEEVLARLFEYIWRMDRALFYSPDALLLPYMEYYPIDEYFARNAGAPPEVPILSEFTADNGYFRARLDKERRYFMALPKPDEGWAFDDTKMLALLRDFADEDFFLTLIDLHRNRNDYKKSYSQQYLERSFNLSPERTKAVLDKMQTYGIAYSSEQLLDEKTVTSYWFTWHNCLVPFLIFLEEVSNVAFLHLGGNHELERTWLK